MTQQVPYLVNNVQKCRDARINYVPSCWSFFSEQKKIIDRIRQLQSDQLHTKHSFDLSFSEVILSCGLITVLNYVRNAYVLFNG